MIVVVLLTRMRVDHRLSLDAVLVVVNRPARFVSDVAHSNVACRLCRRRRPRHLDDDAAHDSRPTARRRARSVVVAVVVVHIVRIVCANGRCPNDIPGIFRVRRASTQTVRRRLQQG